MPSGEEESGKPLQEPPEQGGIPEACCRDESKGPWPGTSAVLGEEQVDVYLLHKRMINTNQTSGTKRHTMSFFNELSHILELILGTEWQDMGHSSNNTVANMQDVYPDAVPFTSQTAPGSAPLPLWILTSKSGPRFLCALSLDGFSQPLPLTPRSSSTPPGPSRGGDVPETEPTACTGKGLSPTVWT